MNHAGRMLSFRPQDFVSNGHLVAPCTGLAAYWIVGYSDPARDCSTIQPPVVQVEHQLDLVPAPGVASDRAWSPFVVLRVLNIASLSVLQSPFPGTRHQFPHLVKVSSSVRLAGD